MSVQAGHPIMTVANLEQTVRLGAWSRSHLQSHCRTDGITY